MISVVDYAEDATVYIPLTTHEAAGGVVAPSSAFEVADFRIYRGATELKSTTNGLTIHSPFDALTGVHFLVIDTSNDTGEFNFWISGGVYNVLLYPDETVDGQTVGKWVGAFRLGFYASLVESIAEAVEDELSGVDVVIPAAFDGGTLTIFKGAEYSSANGNTQTFSFPSLPNLTGGEVRIHIFREYGVPIIDYAQTVNNPSTTKDVVFALPSTETDKLDAPAPYVGQFVYKASGATGYMPANEFQVKTRRM